MNNIKKILGLVILFACFSCTMVSCDSDNSSSDDGSITWNKLYRNMYGTYKGNVTLNNNLKQSVTFTVDSFTVIKNLPIENIIKAAFPSDYENVTASSSEITLTTRNDSIYTYTSSLYKITMLDQLVSFDVTLNGQKKTISVLYKIAGIFVYGTNLFSLYIKADEIMIGSTSVDLTNKTVEYTIDSAQK